ncbi:MAG: AAA family ATPase [Fibromonadaceae bacterium]|jgi:predicted ATP-binding protein involved in virulence|nr:AAA family ATPase [Fibromonadaceae bacterium]
MRIKRIKIENFRCFEELELEFHPRLTVLVAPNGGGKTAILDAIALGLSPMLSRLSSANQRLNSAGFKDIDFRLVNNNKCDHVKIEIETEIIDKSIKWDIAKSSHISKRNDTKIGQKELYDFSNSIIKKIDDKIDFDTNMYLPVFAYYGARRGYIEVPQRLRKSRYAEINYSYPTSALYGALESLTDFKEMLLWFYDEYCSELIRKSEKKDIQSNSYDILQKVRKTIKVLLGSIYYEPRFNEHRKFVIQKENCGTEYSVEQLSQGYQSMLALAMDFSRRLGLARMPSFEKDNMHSIMLIDEVDLHLHPEWQQRVIPDLMRVFKNTQFIVTTHSPHVLTTIKNENIRIIEQDNDGRFIAKEPETPEVKGVESSVALADIQGVNPKPPVKEVELYNDYISEIEKGEQGDKAKKHKLKNELAEIYSEKHPLMQNAEKLERFQEFKKSISKEKIDA